MPRDIRALLFDMDGLIVDTERLFIDCEEKIAGLYGKRLTEETLFKLMSRKPLDSMRIFAEDLGIPENPEELLRVRDGMMLQRMSTDLKAMPGLYDILDAFHRKKKLAVVTGNDRRFLDIVADKLGIRKYFDVLQTSENVTRGKPDPEIYLKAIGLLGLRPEECAVLEDSVNGAKAGKNAGCYVVAVPSVYTKDHDFSFADETAKNLTHARDILLSLESVQ